jgi:FkbM family methyltransferase
MLDRLNLRFGVRAEMIASYFKHKLLKWLHDYAKKKNYQMLAVPSNDYIGQSTVVHGFYEIDLLSNLLFILKVNSISGIYIDVGANIGNHAVFFSPHFDKVIAFEPHPISFQFLKLNAILSPNKIDAYQIALSDHSGTVCLRSVAFNLGKTTISNTRNLDSEPIEALRFDEFTFKGTPGLIKIDVEGHELKVVEGMVQLLAKHSPLLAIEMTTPHNKLIHLLRELGYTYFYDPSPDWRKARGIWQRVKILLKDATTQSSYLSPVDPSLTGSYPLLLISKTALVDHA